MSVTFGSVGDIIATFQIAIQLLTALNESRGSAREIQDLTKSLETFHQLLEQIIAIWPTRSDSAQLESLYQTIIPTIQDCRQEIAAFLDTIISKYGGGIAISGGGPKQKLKHMGKMLQWHLFEGGIVTKLRDKLDNSHGMISLAYLCAQRVAEESDQALVRDKLDFLKNKQSESEYELGQRLQGIQSNLVKQEGILGELSDDLKRVLSTASPIAETTLQIRATNIEMSQMIQALYQLHITQPSISAFLDPYKEQSVILEDALGHSLRIPLETIRTWTVVKQVLIDAFSDREGCDLVRVGRYILQDPLTGHDLSLTVPFHRLIRPGQKIVQTMVFYSNGSKDKANTCPRCETITISSGNQDINCSNLACDVTFRRVTEASDDMVLAINSNKNADLTIRGRTSKDMAEETHIEDLNVSSDLLRSILADKDIDDGANVFKRVRLFTRWQDSVDSRGPKTGTLGQVSVWDISQSADNIAGRFIDGIHDRLTELYPKEYLWEDAYPGELLYYQALFLGKSLQQSSPALLLYSRNKHVSQRVVKLIREDGWAKRNGFLVLSCSGPFWKKVLLEWALKFKTPEVLEWWKSCL